jgi:DNA-binding NarL/FixJ family response regulator
MATWDRPSACTPEEIPYRASRVIRVLLVDDHMIFSQTVAAALNEEADIRVVDCVGSLADARSHLEVTEVDVILLDQRLPDGQGTHAAAELRAIRPGVRVVLVTAAVDPALSARHSPRVAPAS